jgi:hypothetical protein
MNIHLKSMLDELHIPGAEQEKLGTAHGIVSYDTLRAKQYQLDRRELAQVDPFVQRIVATALRFLKSLHDEDPLPKFTKKAWSEFATAPAPLGSTGSHEGGTTMDSSASDSHLGKMVFASDDDNEKRSRDEAIPVGDLMEVDEYVSIQSGEDLGHGKRKRIVTEGDDDNKERNDSDDEDGNDCHEVEKVGKFEFVQQGFNPSTPSLFNIHLGKESIEQEELDVEVILFNGRQLRRGRCYHYAVGSGEAIVVGIKSFKSNDAASCVRVEHISKSFLGVNDNEGEFPKAVSANYPNPFAQFGRPSSIALGDLGEECSEPAEIPNFIYEPQSPGDMTSLGYVRDNRGRKLVQRRRREKIRVLEGFSGAVRIQSCSICDLLLSVLSVFETVISLY